MEEAKDWLTKILHRKAKDKLGTVRELDAFKRLQVKFAQGNPNVRAGLGQSDLTVGDLVDIVHLYAVSSGSQTQGRYREIVQMLGGLSANQNLEETVNSELAKLNSVSADPKDLDRENPLYSIAVDLSLIASENPFELTHYPGGLKIAELIEQNKQPKAMYTLVVHDRQQKIDKGRPIKQAFEEVGLPVRSNIG